MATDTADLQGIVPEVRTSVPLTVMPNAYTEHQLVEQPAILLFSWQAVSPLEEIFGVHHTLPGKAQGGVSLAPHFLTILARSPYV